MRTDSKSNRVALAPISPLFGIRITTSRLVLRVPTDEDLVDLLRLARAGVHPAGESPFINDWASLPSPTFERRFLQYFWALRGEWSIHRWRLPFGAFTHAGEPIGVQQIQATNFLALRTLRSGTWVGLARQRSGFGTEMREAVLELCFRTLGAQFADAGTNETNAGARGMLERLGYRWNGEGMTANGATSMPTPIVNYRLDAATWLTTPRAHIAIHGIDRALGLFGIAGESEASRPSSQSSSDGRAVDRVSAMA